MCKGIVHVTHYTWSHHVVITFFGLQSLRLLRIVPYPREVDAREKCTQKTQSAKLHLRGNFLLQGNYHIYKLAWFLIDESTQHFGFLLLWERYRLVYCFKVGFVRSFWSNFASQSRKVVEAAKWGNHRSWMQVRVSQGKYREFKCQRAELFTMDFKLFSLKQWVLCWTSLIDLYDSILALDLKCTVTSITLLCT